jgi:hypothetical protein
MIIYTYGDGSIMTVRIIPNSGPEKSILVPQWYGRANHQSWLPRQSVWEIIKVDEQTVDLSLNGVTITRQSTQDIGWIMEIGCSVQGDVASPGVVSVFSAVIEESDFATSAPVLYPLIAGDSKTDFEVTADSPGRYPVSWWHYFRATMEGSCGARIVKWKSIASGGESTAQQKTRFDAWIAANPAEWAKVTDVYWFTGTNDISGLIGYTTVYNLLLAMATTCANAGKRLILVSPDDFYAQTLAGGQGLAPSGYQTGAPIRQAIRQLAAQLNIGWVGGQRTIGLELADWLSAGTTPPRTFDNIHNAPLGNAQLGYAIGCESLRMLVQPQSRTTVGLPIPQAFVPAAQAANFAVTSSLQVAVVDGALAVLKGRMNRSGGAWSGTTVLILPRSLRPPEDTRCLFSDGSGGTATALITSATGEAQIFVSGTPAALTFNCSWLLA